MKKVWFITGSSRGLGRSLTEAVLKHGDYVAATARNPQQLKDLEEKFPDLIFVKKLDVTKKEEIYETVADVITHFGRIDVLVNNAGFGITGAAEAFSDEQLRSQLETNLYAPIEVTRAVLPQMRKQRSGNILQISSIGGRIATPGLSIYQAAKFGLSGFSEALAKEVAPLGIKVTAIEPGGFRTDWAGPSMSFAKKVEGYETTVDWVATFLTNGKFVPMGDPEKAAKAIIELVQHPKPPIHLILGSEAVTLMLQAFQTRKEELEEWISLSKSTDHDGAQDFLETEAGKAYASMKA